MSWGPLKQWFKTNGLFVKMRANTRDTRPVTHLLLDGGKITVPPNREDEFLLKYAECMHRGSPLFLVETKTPIYKYMMDLDFAAAKVTGEDEIEKVVKVVHATVALYFPTLTDSQRRMVVCRTDNKNITKDGVKLVKTGIHLIWPEILVDSPLALTVRGGVIYRLTEEFGVRENTNPWCDVVDRCVYVGNGLRMVGSRKMSNCPKCRNRPKKKSSCQECTRTGKKDEGRVYLPTVVLQGIDSLPNQEAYRQLDDIHTLVKQLSIRTTAEAPLAVTLPEWSELVVGTDEDLYDTQGKDGRRQGQKRRRKAEKANSDKRTRLEEDVIGKHKNCNILDGLAKTDRRHKAVAAFIKKTFPNMPEVTQVHPTRTGDYYLARSSSQYCMNKADYHNNTNVYFYIDRNGVRQKCFCTCAVNRAFGPCSKYASDPHTYSSMMRGLLWPEFKKTGVTLASWNRHNARANQEGFLENLIQKQLDYARGKGEYEKQFFPGN